MLGTKIYIAETANTPIPPTPHYRYPIPRDHFLIRHPIYINSARRYERETYIRTLRNIRKVEKYR
jgi:hypothetical protein